MIRQFRMVPMKPAMPGILLGGGQSIRRLVPLVCWYACNFVLAGMLARWHVRTHPHRKRHTDTRIIWTKLVELVVVVVEIECDV